MREGAPSTAAMLRAALPMCEADFLSLCEERALARKCGNPLCGGAPLATKPSEAARIDWSTLELVKVTTRGFWCSKACEAKCVKLAKSLGSPIDRLDVLRRLRPPRAHRSYQCCAFPGLASTT